jgi:hypothetical protein
MYTSTRSNNAIRIVVDILRHREWTSVLDIAQRIELPVIYTYPSGSTRSSIIQK